MIWCCHPTCFAEIAGGIHQTSIISVFFKDSRSDFSPQNDEVALSPMKRPTLVATGPANANGPPEGACE